MNIFGWAIMLVSICFVLSLTVYCYAKVLSLPPLGPDEHT